MHTDAPSCSKCDSNMEAGFVADQTYGSHAESKWSRGPAETSFWTGLKVDTKAQKAITTYRCTRCGYLESYAR